MKEPATIDPALLKKGDLFRGTDWKRGKNHKFKEIIPLGGKQEMLVASECCYWFNPFNLHEPSKNKKNNCSRCFKKKGKT